MAVSITKPTVGGSSGSWGTQLNTALDALAAGVNASIPVLPLLATATSATALTAGSLQPFNASSGAITNPALPALSGLAVGTTYGMEKVDTSTNTVTIPFASGDTSLTGATQFQLALPGTFTVQVVSNAAGNGKLWKVIDHVRSDGALAAAFASINDVRFAGAPAPGPTYNLLPQNLPYLRRAISRVRAGSGSGLIVCVGDSTTAGSGSTTQGQAYPSVLAALLNAYYIPCAQSWAMTSTVSNTSTPSVNREPRLTMGSNWTNYDNSAWANTSGTSDTLSFAPSSAGMAGPATVDSFDIYTVGGSFSANIDGGTATTWTAPSSSTTNTKTTITAASPGTSRVLNITTSNGYVRAIRAYDSTKPRLEIANIGVGGSKTSDWQTASHPASLSYSTFGSNFNADCTIIDLGINDAGNNVSVSTFTSNMNALANLAKSTGDVVFKSFVPSDGSPYLANEPPIVAAVKSIAASFNAPYIDVFSRFVSYAVSNPLGYYTDALHPSTFGYSDVAQAVFGALRTV